MRVREYIYDSASAAGHVDEVLDLLAARDEPVEHTDVAAADDREDGLNRAMLSLRESIRIGSNPPEVFDDDGSPDFSTGVLVTEAETGRRTVHVGEDALDALADDDR